MNKNHISIDLESLLLLFLEYMTGPKREYKKVDIVKRKELINLVFHKGMKIKEVR